MAAADPDMYQHPSPRGTNPHWQPEIDNGPHLESRGRKKPNTTGTRRRTLTNTTERSNISNEPSSLDVSSIGGSRDGRNDSKFDFKQYQREDEEMWGMASRERLAPNAFGRADEITKPPRARTRGGDIEPSYTSYRNPQINDFHPATVTKLNSHEEARWIFQPLPNADVMKGRERSSRSRSDSGTSSWRSVRSSAQLPQDITQRITERNSKTREDSVSANSSLVGSFRTPNYITTPSFPSIPSKDRSVMEQKDFAPVEDTPANVDRIGSSLIKFHVSDSSEESAATVVHSPDMAPEPLRKRQPRALASKPQLSTIVSDSIVPSEEDRSRTSSEKPQENSHPGPRHSDHSIDGPDRTSRRSALPEKDDALKVLRDLAPSSAIFNTAVVSTDDLAIASKKKPRVSSATSEDRKQYDLDPEILETWDSADFELPQWIHEHTKREVKERWSMDI